MSEPSRGPRHLYIPLSSKASIPGIGKQTAVGPIALIGDVGRFPRRAGS